ncbi:MAG: adenosylcobinamide-phosphate synthase CbiB [Pseudomonadota bacterium]
MTDFLSIWILPAAFALDLILGDPTFLPHPIRWMGNAIAYWEPRFRTLPVNAGVSGAFFSIFLILSTFFICFLLVALFRWMDPVLGFLMETILVYYCISAGSLKDAAMEVYQALHRRDLETAKSKISMIVGRDVANLDQQGITRAAVETVAENLVDGVLSPLFFAAIGGAPLAMAYKMVNTLDSMIGYKNEKYIDFGKTSARIDDVGNFIPARASVPIIAASSQILWQSGNSAFRTAIREGRNHTSPNAGYPEAAFAGSFQIKLGGPNIYHGKLISKPYIGTNFRQANPDHIQKACRLMMVSSCVGLLIFWLIGISIRYCGSI